MVKSTLLQVSENETFYFGRTKFMLVKHKTPYNDLSLCRIEGTFKEVYLPNISLINEYIIKDKKENHFQVVNRWTICILLCAALFISQILLFSFSNKNLIPLSFVIINAMLLIFTTVLGIFYIQQSKKYISTFND